MFSQSEMDALLLGMRWVSTFVVASLAKVSIDALAKIAAVLPAEQRNNLGAVPLSVGPPVSPLFHTEDLSILRDAIRHERKLEISYRTDAGKQSTRIVVAWC